MSPFGSVHETGWDGSKRGLQARDVAAHGLRAHAYSRVCTVSPVGMKWGWGRARRGRGVPFRAPVVLRTSALVAPACVHPKRSSQNVGDYLSLINSVSFILF